MPDTLFDCHCGCEDQERNTKSAAYEVSRGQKTRLHNTRVLEHKFNNRELHTQHIFLTTQQDRNWSLIFG